MRIHGWLRDGEERSRVCVCVCVCVCEREAAQDRHRAEAQKEEFKVPAEGNIRLSFKFMI